MFPKCIRYGIINTVNYAFYVMKSLFLLRCDWMQVEADSSKYKSRCLPFTAMYLMLLNQLVISLLTLEFQIYGEWLSIVKKLQLSNKRGAQTNTGEVYDSAIYSYT